MGTEAQRLRARRAEALVDAGLIALVLFLAAARFVGGPWYAQYAPMGMRLMEGLPASWEAHYFLSHVPTFLGDVPARLGIAPVDYRTYVNLFLFTHLTGWTGSAYWSLAAVDVLLWVLASVCTHHLGLRLGAGRLAAAAGAVLVAGSPIHASYVWHQDMHLANTASLPLGLWAAVTLIQEHRSLARLAGGLGLVLVYLSLSYQYQWFVAPAAFVVAAFHPRLGLRRAVLVVGGAAAVFLLATVLIRALLAFSGLGPTAEQAGAVQDPGALLSTRVNESRTLEGLLAALPGPHLIAGAAAAYHPLVFWPGLLGLLLLGRRGLAVAAVTFVLPLLYMWLYPVPWVAMTGYPLVYLGAGLCCERLARLVALPLLRARPGNGRPDHAARAVAAFAAVSAAGLFFLTNTDLLGDPVFALRWWGAYFPIPIH